MRGAHAVSTAGAARGDWGAVEVRVVCGGEGAQRRGRWGGRGEYGGACAGGVAYEMGVLARTLALKL